MLHQGQGHRRMAPKEQNARGEMAETTLLEWPRALISRISPINKLYTSAKPLPA